jgi:hypothetical protein
VREVLRLAVEVRVVLGLAVEVRVVLRLAVELCVVLRLDVDVREVLGDGVDVFGAPRDCVGVADRERLELADTADLDGEAEMLPLGDGELLWLLDLVDVCVVLGVRVEELV